MILQKSPEGYIDERRVSMPTGEMAVGVRKSHFSLEDLTGFAARDNAKRGFLFVSKVLGKHWPVRPNRMIEVHDCLAGQIPEYISAPVVFIGMAETAVGLGQGVFESWRKRHPNHRGMYLHTSRYRVCAGDLIEFQEAHSHAPHQYLHMPADQALRVMMRTAKSLVLIDDEASTGNTFLNLFQAYRTLNIDVENVHLATITNFMGEIASSTLSERFGLRVTHCAALDGDYKFVPGNVPLSESAGNGQPELANVNMRGTFGRLGIDRILERPVDLAITIFAQIAYGETVLVVGTGEFLHPPFLLARELEVRGVDVTFQSTTRSPILQWGAVESILSFPDIYGEGVDNFLYNVLPGQYDHVLICHETGINPGLTQLAHQLNGRLIYFKNESGVG